MVPLNFISAVKHSKYLIWKSFGKCWQLDLGQHVGRIEWLDPVHMCAISEDDGLLFLDKCESISKGFELLFVKGPMSPSNRKSKFSYILRAR